MGSWLSAERSQADGKKREGGQAVLRKIIPNVIHDQKIVHLGTEVTARQAALFMREHNVGAVLIMDDEALKGILTVNDMTYRVVAEGRDPDETVLREIMTPDPDSVSSDTTAIEALRLMQDGGYRHLPVVDDGEVLGVVSRRDFHGVEKARLDDETALWERIA
jgi:CBS domain-containing protein